MIDHMAGDGFTTIAVINGELHQRKGYGANDGWRTLTPPFNSSHHIDKLCVVRFGLARPHTLIQLAGVDVTGQRALWQANLQNLQRNGAVAWEQVQGPMT